MITFLANEEIGVAVPFTWGGEPFVPDAGTTEYELRGHNGAVLRPRGTLAGVDNTSVVVTLPAGDNQLADGQLAEKRTLIVTGKREGFPFTVTVPYRLTVFLNLAAGPQDVRTFLGIDDGELPDDEIDLVAAYFEIGGDVLQPALAGEPRLEKAANRAVVAQAVLDLLPSLPARISAKASDGKTLAERYDIDFDKLEAKAQTALDRALKTIAPPPTATTRSLIAVTTRTDPLTGA